MLEELKKQIRDVPDFPKKGIVFKDITTLLNDPVSFNNILDLLKQRYTGKEIDTVIGIESRGFIIGSALAYALKAGFAPIRKAGKLPYKTYKMSYELEYGTDTIEIHQDAAASGKRVLIVDDLIATGGTALASAELVKKLNADIVELAFIVELTFLNGRDKLKDYEVFSLLKF